MFIEMSKRNYRMRERAFSQERTRQRIVEAAAALHGSVGPKETSVSAVAREAGVQRLTVYRHFPDEASLFRACSSHWLSENPPPDPAAWQRLPDAGERSAAALDALYAYYRATEYMWSLVYRDRDEVPAMGESLSEFEAWLDAIRDDLASAWHPRGRKPKILMATIGHVLRFETWHSLAGLGLSDAQARDAAVGWIAASLD
jgi:AcrR family transcriptional regulator